MRRTGKLKESFLSFENLYWASKKAYRGTKSYSSYRFAFNADRELLQLQHELRHETYAPGDYRYFTITDPKERIISIAQFRDRVVHHALVNILEPIYEKRFIYDSYATRKEKGTHKAIKRAQSFIGKKKWYLKLDIRKYFDSIDHDKLCNILDRTIKDNHIMRLCRKIISKGGAEKKGLPIGNLTSQFFANVYLDIFDHYIKEEMRVKCYLRYMDDFCIFSDDKGWIKEFRFIVTDYLKQNLFLSLKEQAVLINSALHGLPFLGCRIFPAMIRVKRENFKRSYARLRQREREYRTGRIGYHQYHASMQSLTAHLRYWHQGLLSYRLWGVTSQAFLTA